MEVHHHPQLKHNPKPWKEYFLEFLMIFLAVTMGFFAESLRENISNKEKGHQFIVSLMADLESDTAKMDAYFIRHTKDVGNYKVLVKWLDKPIRNIDTGFRSRFYKAAWSTLGMGHVYFTNRIIAQLKNSDNFRLIINHKVADAITDYSNGTVACDSQSDVVNHFSEEGSKPAMEMINLKAYKDYFLDDKQTVCDNTVPFKSTDPKVVQEYSNSIYLKAGVEQNYAKLIKKQEERALQLIDLLKKEYDLE